MHKCSIFISRIITALILTVPTTYATVIHVPSEQPTIQAGIDAASEHDTVLVADGTYTGDGNYNINFGGKNILLKSESGPENTIILYQNLDPINNDDHLFIFQSGETSDAILEGFVLSSGISKKGGAIIIEGSSPIIRNCIFESNKAATGFAHPINVYAGEGGAIYCNNGSPYIVGCLFINNQAAAGYYLHCDDWGSNCIMLPVPGSGGALFFIESESIIKNCTFINNKSDYGASINSLGGTIIIQNCIVTNSGNNSAERESTALDVEGETIICTNIFDNIGGDWVGSIADLVDIDGNFSADPKFCDKVHGNYHISKYSPCAPANSPCGELIGALGVGCNLPSNSFMISTVTMKPGESGILPLIINADHAPPYNGNIPCKELKEVKFKINYEEYLTIDSISFEGTAFKDWDTVYVINNNSYISAMIRAPYNQFMELPVESVLANIHFTIDVLYEDLFIPLKGITSQSEIIRFCENDNNASWTELLRPQFINGGVEVIAGEKSIIAFDIKPGSCPNPIGLKRNNGKKVLPAAILGSEDFDIHDIDPTSLRLLGLTPIRWGYDDVGTLFDGENCECSEADPDGYNDLTLKFDYNDLIDTLIKLPFEARMELPLLGLLKDRSVIEGSDCVRLLKNGRDYEISEIDGDIIPLEATLVGNNPNPFNPITTINYGLPSLQHVKIVIFNMLGQKVITLVDKSMPAGYHTVEWDASQLSSGIYLYRLTTNEFIETKKMVLLK